MYFKKINGCIRYVYHYTTIENAKQILLDKEVKTGLDKFSFYAASYEDSVMLFNELMTKEISYIDNSLSVKKRIPQNSEQYVILKIAVEGNQKFYRFNCKAEGFNPYEYSLLHNGSLRFEQAEMLSIRKLEIIDSSVTKGTLKSHRLSCVTKKALASCAACMILGMSSITALASTSERSWNENGCYDISWYNESDSEFTLTSAKQLAGLSYLSNNGNDFKDKTIKIENDIDLSSRDWVSLPSSFNGTVEGIHLIYISFFSENEVFADDKKSFNNIQFKTTNNRSTTVTYNVEPSYTITIPTEVTISENTNGYTGSGEISTTGAVRIAYGKKIYVTVESKNAFNLKSAENAAQPYTIKADDTIITATANQVATFEVKEAAQKAELTYSAEEPAYSGTFTDLLTFTIAVR